MSSQTTRATPYQIQPNVSNNSKDPYSQSTNAESTNSTEDCCNDICRECCSCFGLCCNGCLNFNEWLICCWTGSCDC